jgi:hypothetical protein
MATLATLFRRPLAPAAAASNAATIRPVPVEDLFRLRALPNEDIYLFCKTIDNTRVVRQSDPRSRRQCWTFIGIACVLAALLTGLLAPGVANIFTGYRLQTLKQEELRLLNERRLLDVDEAQLTSRERLQALAATRDLQTPEPGQVVHLDPKGDGTLALNRH